MSELITELQNLIRLTDTEAMVASARQAQAANDEVRQELEANAADANDRARRLAEAIRSLGGVPDVVGRTMNRLRTAARLQAEQAFAPREALLNDLRLEHELRERARFARVLAQVSGKPTVVELLERIENSHDETIDWIDHRLGEMAIGGPSAIRATPTQLAAKAGQRLAFLPARAVTKATNRTLHGFSVAQERTARALEENTQRSRLMAAAIADGAIAARDAFLGRTEAEARRHEEPGTAANVRQLRADVGALDDSELPIADYEDLTVGDINERLAAMDDPADVRAVLAYEEAHRARKGVLNAAVSRQEELVEELVAR